MAELRRFYTERDNLRAASSVKLLAAEAKHIRDVLRMKPGDKVVLFNGNRQFMAELKVVNNDVVMAEIVTELEQDKSANAQVVVSLAQGIIRLPQFEVILQKATELGVDNIIPIQAEFSQARLGEGNSREERWNRIILEACKQSERTSIPQLYQVASFTDVIKSMAEMHVDYPILLTTPRLAVSKIAEIQNLQTVIGDIKTRSKRNTEPVHICLFVGPEGGFSPMEHTLARDNNIPFAYFSNQILKSETAAIAACAITEFAFL